MHIHFTHNPLIQLIFLNLKFEFNHTKTLDSIRKILHIWGNVLTLSMCDWSAIQTNQLDLQIASVALSMWSGSLSCSFVKHQPAAFLLIILLFNCTREGHWLTGSIYIIFQSACSCLPFILHTNALNSITAHAPDICTSPSMPVICTVNTVKRHWRQWRPHLESVL